MMCGNNTEIPQEHNVNCNSQSQQTITSLVLAFVALNVLCYNSITEPVSTTSVMPTIDITV